MHEIIKWKEDTNFHYQDNRQQSFTKDWTGLVWEMKQTYASFPEPCHHRDQANGSSGLPLHSRQVQ